MERKGKKRQKWAEKGKREKNRNKGTDDQWRDGRDGGNYLLFCLSIRPSMHPSIHPIERKYGWNKTRLSTIDKKNGPEKKMDGNPAQNDYIHNDDNNDKGDRKNLLLRMTKTMTTKTTITSTTTTRTTTTTTTKTTTWMNNRERWRWPDGRTGREREKHWQ